MTGNRMISRYLSRVLLFTTGLAAVVLPSLGSSPPTRIESAAPPLPSNGSSSLRDGSPSAARYWDVEPHSAARISLDDQALVIPGPDDEVRVIAQLRDDPVALRRQQILGSRRRPTPNESATLRQYAITLAAQRRLFMGQVQQQKIAQSAHREYGYLLSGVAMTIKMRDWNRLERMPQVAAVYPDYQMRAVLDDSVPLIGAPQVWQMTDANGHAVTGQGIRVAIIDTGVDYTHPDLGGCYGSACRVIGGYDFVDNDADPMDLNGHGTHVAGIVAANGVLKGVAPDARLLAYRVLDASGSGKESDIIAALERAADPDGDPGTDDGAQVMNLSLGGDGNPDDPLSQAVDDATGLGIVVVAAAGNFGGYGFQTITSPGVARQAITVAASDKSDQYAIFSSRGPILGYEGVLKPDITAPGVEIRSTVPLAGALGSPDRYRVLSGTSMATPHISGSAALLKQLHPDWSTEFIKASLMNTAKDLGKSAYEQGAGRVQVAQAATSSLVSTPSSWSFGIPGPKGASVQLTLKNPSPSPIILTASVATFLWANDALTPLTIPVPVAYTQLDQSSVSIPANGVSHLNVTVTAPSDAVEGYYVGNVILQSGSVSWRVPIAFMELSKVRVHILDEHNAEVTKLSTDFRQQGVAYLLRTPDLDVRRSSGFDNQPPSTFYVPSGAYNVHGYAQFWIYDGALGIASSTPRPLFLSTAIVVDKNQTQDVYLRAAQAHRFTLAATNFEGAPEFVPRWRALSHYQSGTHEYLTGMDLSYTGYKDTSFGGPLPGSFDFYIDDTLPNLDFTFASDSYGYSARQARFQKFNSAEWYEDHRNGSGFDLIQNADQAFWYAWQFPNGVTPQTSRTFQYKRDEVSHYRMRYDIYGVLDRNWTPLDTNFSAGGDAAFYLPSDKFAFLTPLSAGLDRDLYFHGSFAYRYWNYRAYGDQMFEQELYSRDWTRAVTTTEAANIWTIPGPDLSPLVAQDITGTLGAGPFYPAVTFNNDSSAIRLVYPLLGSSAGHKTVWGDTPTLAVYRDASQIYSDALNEWWWTPSPMRQIPIQGSGAYRVVITSTANSALAMVNSIEAGWNLPSLDMNPPRVNSLEMPQRFSPGQSIPITVTVADAESGVGRVDLQWSGNVGTTWTGLSLSHAGNRYWATVNVGQAESISLRLSVWDQAGNYLIYVEKPAAILETPTAFALNVSPAIIPVSSNPYTLQVTGSLRKMDGQPLGQAAVPVKMYMNDQYVGFVRNVARRPNGTFDEGAIQFGWTFVPTDFLNAPGVARINFVFDVGAYARQEKAFSLIVANSLFQRYLPLVPNVYPP